MGEKKDKKKCNDAICRYLSRYISSEVSLTLYSSEVISGELYRITEDGLIVLRETEVLSPFIGEVQILVRSSDVEHASIQIES